MDALRVDRARRGSFWQAFGAALAVLAGRSLCSLAESPLPEIREAARDFAEWSPGPSPGHTADLG